MTALWVALAGGAGAVVRLVVDGEVRARSSSAVPWATWLINVTGSLLLGVLTGLVIWHGAASDTRLVAGAGFCGGYTTFSTASVETVRLGQQRRVVAAAVYAVGSLLAAVAAAAAGLALAWW